LTGRGLETVCCCYRQHSAFHHRAF
jgi:hypothetical protein